MTYGHLKIPKSETIKFYGFRFIKSRKKSKVAERWSNINQVVASLTLNLDDIVLGLASKDASISDKDWWKAKLIEAGFNVENPIVKERLDKKIYQFIQYHGVVI